MPQLPLISNETRQRIHLLGYQNQLYKGMMLSNFAKVYTPEYKFFTYTSMGACLGLYGLARRFNYLSAPFLVALVLIPSFVLIHKVETDKQGMGQGRLRSNINSILDDYPNLKISFQQVKAEANNHISQLEREIKNLQNQIGSKSNFQSLIE